MATDVFISYSSKEASVAYMLKSVLEENGISCWMAPESIPPGSNYAEEIPDGIGGCTVFILLLSAKAQRSTWVSLELDEALNQGKMVIPYAIENCELSKAFDFRLKACQRMDAYEKKARAVEELVKRIKAVVASESKTESGAETGKIIHENSVYEGGIKDGKRHGKGTLTWTNGDVYEGDFVDGKRSGFGRYTWANGDVYEGNYVNGTRSGDGKYTWANGDVFTGEYRDGEIYSGCKYNKEGKLIARYQRGKAETL